MGNSARRWELIQMQRTAIKHLYLSLSALDEYVEAADEIIDILPDREAWEAQKLEILKETIEDVLDEVVGL